MNCVCGHSRVDHPKTLMSVPMRKEWETPYTRVGPPCITLTYPDSTYEHDECWCGCTIFTPDT